ncbi:Flp pilus assembly protein CpaB [Actinorugispora endophytica]|uniref:Flp pilus assembly protein CpaB n=1 Tax=Actinorugispora endophytica TaxID=1605990 RepID=A0A4R6UC44_9ACTN|nr:SAF domain-containing protein [Actinorugispora endophytica]TDQ44260.1 Flp pilus assembly protein CpaB [Actinorugispora endophytica]
MKPPRGRPLRLGWHRWRRPLGAACAAAAVAGALLVLRPPPPPSVEVLVAARDLSALEPLTGTDTAVRAVPEPLAPDGALPPDHPIAGASLRSPVRAGEVLTGVRLADPPAAGHGAGLVAAPVRVADPDAVALLRPGSRIDVLAAAGDPLSTGYAEAPPARTVVTDRPVIAVPSAAPGTAEPGALVLIAVTEEEARTLAGHAPAGRLSITIRG